MESVLKKIDGRGYKAYKELKGITWKVSGIEFRMIKVQSDPFAPPSVVEVTVRRGFPVRVPSEDFLHRRIYEELKRRSKKRGEGKSGFLGVPKASNAMLRRSSVKATPRETKFKVWVGLPSIRRRVLADEALEMLTSDLPSAVRGALNNTKGLEDHIRTYEIYVDVKKFLSKNGYVAFIGDGSVLPRACSACEEPLKGAVPFESPSTMRVEIETKHGIVSGMGIEEGITAITGPAFHGKTTLLEALARGVWPHVPGDGRERVVVLDNSFYIRSEDGRRVSCVDISTFLNLKGSQCFSSDDSSGATSAASSFQESVEGGTKALLLDEDYTATNFLFFDDRLEIIYDTKTVYTVSEKLESMKQKGLSLILVASGSAPIIAKADKVIYMKNYLPRDVTERAKLIDVRTGTSEYHPPKERKLRYKPPKKVKVRGPWLEAREWRSPVRLEANIHIVEEGQLNYLAKLMERSFEGDPKDVEVPEPWELCTSPKCSEVRGLDYLFALNRSEGLRAFQG